MIYLDNFLTIANYEKKRESYLFSKGLLSLFEYQYSDSMGDYYCNTDTHYCAEY